MTSKSLSQNDLDFIAASFEATPEGVIEDEESIEISPEERAFTEQASKGPRPPKEIGRGRSLLNAPLKGFSRIAGGALGAMPSGGKTFQETIEETFPTQEGRFIEPALQRGTEIAAGGGAAGGLKGLIGSLLGGVLGEGVHQAPFIPEGAKPYAEFAAEVGSLGIPKLGSKIQPTAAQKPLVEEARRLGLSEKEIAPLIQSDKKLATLSKGASKRGRAEKVLKKSKNVLNESLKSIESHPDIEKVLAPQQAEGVISSIEDKMVKKLNSSERGLVRDDFSALKDSPKSAGDFIKFFRDINKQISTNPKSRTALNLLKDDLVDSVQKISPDLGNTLQTTNKLYSNYSKIAQKLNPSWNEDIARTLGTGVGHVVVGSLFGSYPALATIAGEQVAKKLAREMLINPRFQNLSKQIVTSLNSGKLGVATQLWDKLGKLVAKQSPQVALEMEKVDWSAIQEGEGSDGEE